MHDNAFLLMILFMAITFCVLLGTFAVLLTLHRHSKAVNEKHLCEFAQEGGGCYTLLLPIKDNMISAPEEHTAKYKIGFYVTDKLHTFICKWPEGWPPFLQTKIGKSYYEEGDMMPRVPALRDKEGKVLGLSNIITPEMMLNWRKEKVGEQLRAYGDREREITQAIRGMIKPWVFYIYIAISIILLIVIE